MLRGLNGVHCSWFICRDSFTCITVLHVFEFCIPLLVGLLLFIAVYWKLAGIGLLPRTPLPLSLRKASPKQEAYLSTISVSISTRLINLQ